MKGNIYSITYAEAVDFLLPRHYSGRKPNISKAYGWYIKGNLVAVCTFGKPASRTLCTGICGKEHSQYVYELNRLCRVEECAESLSQFVAACLRRMSPAIIVSYSDTAMNHHGYVYQACNFIYTGCTKTRTIQYTEGGKHSRHAKQAEQQGLRKVRTAKHRYVYFSAQGCKQLKKQWIASLNYPVEPYPKGDNSTYVYGEYLLEKIIDVRKEQSNDTQSN